MTRHLTDEEISLLADEVSSEIDEVDASLMGHIGECTRCRQELAFARTIEEGLVAVPRMAAPPELFEGVMGAIATARASQRRVTAMLASLAAALVMLVAWWLVTGGAATVVLDTLDLARSARMLATVVSAIGETLSLELIFSSALVLLASSAALGRLMTRINRAPDATAVAG